MKKIILASVVTLFFSAGVMAQTSAPISSDKKEDMKDLRKDIRDERKDKNELHKERKEGDNREAKELKKDLSSDKKGIREDTKDLKADGVKHPQKKAEKQIRRERKKKNG